jgi:preprotein translocase subunit SecG
MQTNLNIAQIILSIALIVIVLFQVRGGGLGGIFGQQSGVYRTRRGVEKVLFRLTGVSGNLDTNTEAGLSFTGGLIREGILWKQ